MSSKHNLASRLLAVFALATLSLATVAQAQPYGPGRGGCVGQSGAARASLPACAVARATCESSGLGSCSGICDLRGDDRECAARVTVISC